MCHAPHSYYDLHLNEDGDKKWYKNGLIHRRDLPAVEYAGGGTKTWYMNGKLHRDNELPTTIYIFEPAVKRTAGTYVNGRKRL